MGASPLLLTSSDFSRQSLATLCFRRHMRHVAPLSPVTSVDCAYFLSPRGVRLSISDSKRSIAPEPPLGLFLYAQARRGILWRDDGHVIGQVVGDLGVELRGGAAFVDAVFVLDRERQRIF